MNSAWTSRKFLCSYASLTPQSLQWCILGYWIHGKTSQHKSHSIKIENRHWIFTNIHHQRMSVVGGHMECSVSQLVFPLVVFYFYFYFFCVYLLGCPRTIWDLRLNRIAGDGSIAWKQKRELNWHRKGAANVCRNHPKDFSRYSLSVSFAGNQWIQSSITFGWRCHVTWNPGVSVSQRRGLWSDNFFSFPLLKVVVQ